MTPKNKAAWVAGSTFVLTALVTIFRELEPGYAKGIWFITVSGPSVRNSFFAEFQPLFF
jgi:hypothetical protein